MMSLTSRQAIDFRVCLWRGQITSLRLEGELDLACTGVLARAARVVPAHASIVTVDLEGLTFLDGSGADALCHFEATQVARGREVRLLRARPHVRRVLDAVGMASLLTTAPGPRGPAPLHLVPCALDADPPPYGSWRVDPRGVVELRPV